MHSVEQAREQILAAVQPLPNETVTLAEAFGRFSAEAVRSTIDLPPADNSAMDGYAVRANDIRTASAATPVALRVIGSAAAGVVFDRVIIAGECVRIFTGSMLPKGADAVVMQEDARQDGGDATRVLILDKAAPWENCRLHGEDIKSGAIMLEAGARLTAPALSYLAAAGIGSVRVARRPIVGLLATGDELREAGTPLPPGAIYESNRTGLAALVKSAGAVARVFPLAPDNLEATKSALERALAECDSVITTGGVSVGEMDWVKAAFEGIGGRLDFWKVAMRPGKPFVFGRREGKLLFGLPGNPVSAMVTFILLTLPALLRMQGARDALPRTIPAVLSEPLANPGERRHFMRVTLDAQGNARASGNQSSHILSALAAAIGLADVPPQTTLPAGTIVRVIPLE
ncbi:MAG TPA: gephyrin-like molybdotransferase Glp [Verrucomicrobiae bacterium]|jgi:molybdopterin molybdotransferase|nr:gephyrin-like molybdotransferase Glp [Verrucomicrobiae bacterium]